MVYYLDIIVEKITAIFDKQKQGIVIVSKTIGAITPTVIGLDDMSNGGEFTGDEDIVYEVEIDATGIPDTFKWSEDGEEKASGVSITGNVQELSNGVTIKFNATTGHTLADKWTFTARSRPHINPEEPRNYHKCQFHWCWRFGI